MKHLGQDADVLKESAGPGTMAEGTQAAAQEAQANAIQGPAPAQQELGTGSGALASSALKREIGSKGLGCTGGFDMYVEGACTEVSVSKIRIASCWCKQR